LPLALNFERERERWKPLMAEVLKTTAELTAVPEAAARRTHGLPSETVWRRLVTSFSPVLSGAGLDAQNACAVVASGTATFDRIAITDGATALTFRSRHATLAFPRLTVWCTWKPSKLECPR
jgi:hypothetical protein